MILCFHIDIVAKLKYGRGQVSILYKKKELALKEMENTILKRKLIFESNVYPRPYVNTYQKLVCMPVSYSSLN